jgi:hypothetical protein
MKATYAEREMLELMMSDPAIHTGATAAYCEALLFAKSIILLKDERIAKGMEKLLHQFYLELFARFSATQSFRIKTLEAEVFRLNLERMSLTVSDECGRVGSVFASSRESRTRL